VRVVARACGTAAPPLRLYVSTQRLTWVDETRGAAAAVLVQTPRVVLVLVVDLVVPQRHRLLSLVRISPGACMYATQPADWRRPAEALGSLREASGEPAGQRQSQLTFDIARGLPAAAAAALAPAPAQGLACSSRSPRLGSRGAEGRRAAASSYPRRPTSLTRLRSRSRNHRRVTVLVDATAGLNRLHVVVPHNYLIFYPGSLSPYPPLSYACAALMPPPAGACSSEHSHDTPTAQCVQWCKPSDQHCARAPHHLPCACPCLRRSHGAAWLFFLRCQVLGASAEAVTGAGCGRRRAACCRRRRRFSDAALRR
jgi:hypothetical protein